MDFARIAELARLMDFVKKATRTGSHRRLCEQATGGADYCKSLPSTQGEYEETCGGVGALSILSRLIRSIKLTAPRYYNHHFPRPRGGTLVATKRDLHTQNYWSGQNNNFPDCYYEVRRILDDLGLGYKKIHACKNNCILFYGDDNKFLDICPMCKESRYKPSSSSKGENVPWMVLRYLLLIPRLKRLYMSSRTGKKMRWHGRKRTDDDTLRHPADGEAWKSFDRSFPDFAADFRNVRLRLATDGFNPFGNMSLSHSTCSLSLILFISLSLARLLLSLSLVWLLPHHSGASSSSFAAAPPPPPSSAASSSSSSRRQLLLLLFSAPPPLPSPRHLILLQAAPPPSPPLLGGNSSSSSSSRRATPPPPLLGGTSSSSRRV
ncbi:hypothetical protein ACLB2K_037085 [Fragaria x ananassa]